MESRSPSDEPSSALDLDGGWAPFPGWRVLRVGGADRVRFLNSQVTADVRGLGEGATTLAALLDASARLLAFFFVHRRPADLLLLVPGECAAPTRAALSERVVADDVTIEELPTGELRLALGPAAVLAAHELPPDQVLPLEAFAARGVVTWAAAPLDLPPLDAGELEARRLLTGLPRWGHEVEAGMLVTETALMTGAVSRTKGCYLGQETVAKVESGRGALHAPVLLRCGAVPADPATLVGRELEIADERPARVLGACSWQGELVLQLRLHRSLRITGRRLAGSVAGVALTGTVHPLPLLEAPPAAEVARRLHETAVARFAAGDEAAAVALLERALAVLPGCADACESLGVILGRQERYDEAIELMRRVLEADPESVLAHTNLSLFYNRLGRIEDAEREQSAAAAAALRAQQSLREQAAAEREEEQARRAEAARRRDLLERVIQLDPDDALANLGLAELLLDEGDAAAAFARAERVLAQDDRSSNAHLVRARALEALGEVARACDGYRRGIEVAAARGDLMTASRMQERLAGLSRTAGAEVG